jgi:alpha/beta superfamily hydrolase
VNDLAKTHLEELRLMLDTGSGPRLEGRLARVEGAPLAVLCHPHPLFGGTMDNAVVMLLRDTFWELGIGTLRFNYRGVGQSEGSYGGGDGEADDLRGLVELIQRGEHVPAGIILAGYSFGAWTAATVCSKGFEPHSLILVSPPIHMLDFDGLLLPEAPSLIAVGEQDDLCSQSRLQAWLHTQPEGARQPQLRIMPGGDHFWAKEMSGLRDAVLSFASDFLGAHST